MQTIEEFKKRLEIQEEIFLTMIINYEDYKFLQKPDTQYEKETINKNDFLQRTKFNFWMISIIDLCKLFGSKKEEYCFHKLITLLEYNYWKSSWKQVMPRKTIRDLKLALNSKEVCNTTEKIVKLRNKLYAHRDGDFEKHFADFRITLGEIDFLLELGKKIIFEINKSFFDSHTFFSVGGFQKAKSLVNRVDNLK